MLNKWINRLVTEEPKAVQPFLSLQVLISLVVEEGTCVWSRFVSVAFGLLRKKHAPFMADCHCQQFSFCAAMHLVFQTSMSEPATVEEKNKFQVMFFLSVWPETGWLGEEERGLQDSRLMVQRWEHSGPSNLGRAAPPEPRHPVQLSPHTCPTPACLL